MSANNLKRTPLYDCHKTLNAKLVEFGGWEMPISYETVIAEHQAVRNACGIFDVSHMGEIFVSGADAVRFLQWLTINDINRLKPGQGQYSAFLNHDGGIIDDLIVYCLKEGSYLLCVNASNIEKDFAWVKEQSAKFNVNVKNDSSAWSQIAVQGPHSMAAMETLIAADDKAKFSALEYMGIATFNLFGTDAYVARTGYTGEHGYEIYLPNAIAVKTWEALFATSAKTGLKPIGLGARDTLRLEACYLLYGNDMNDTVSPLEAGIAWAVRMEKENFIGKTVLANQKEKGVPRKIVCFIMEEKGIARHDMDVYVGEKLVGKVTSASFLPTLEQAGGMALIQSDAAKVGDKIEIDIRGKRKLAKIEKRPLYSARVK